MEVYFKKTLMVFRYVFLNQMLCCVFAIHENQRLGSELNDDMCN